MAHADAVLTIHSSKAHITSTLTLPTTSLADAIIQLAIAKGERHEVSLLFFVVNLYGTSWDAEVFKHELFDMAVRKP